LMPSYNPGDEIIATLDSLRAQTIPFKLFVIDDGSARKPDYANLLVGIDHHLIISPHNLGVNEARNPALEAILAEGHEFIALIDCGDIAMPQRLSEQLSFLEARPDIGIVGSAVELVDETSGRRRLLTYPVSPEGARRALWFNMPVSHPAIMLRSDVFRKVGLYSGQYEAAEDYDLMRRADRAGIRILNLPNVLLRKIENGESVSVKRRNQQLRSRMRIQWHNMAWSNPSAWFGLLRTMAIITLPANVQNAIKARFRR
jgi:glycosyltransferase involved in cell wall biosynthesis